MGNWYAYKDKWTDIWMSGSSPLCSTGHWPFENEATAEKRPISSHLRMVLDRGSNTSREGQ